MKDAQDLYAKWLEDSESVAIMNKSEADYSTIKRMLGFDKKKDANSAAITNGTVQNNIVASKDGKLGVISQVAKDNGKIENNKVYNISDEKVLASFKDFANGKYAIEKDSLLAKENENYNNIPYYKIGRVNEQCRPKWGKSNKVYGT